MPTSKKTTKVDFSKTDVIGNATNLGKDLATVGVDLAGKGADVIKQSAQTGLCLGKALANLGKGIVVKALDTTKKTIVGTTTGLIDGLSSGLK